MKKYIRSSDNPEKLTPMVLRDILKSHNIDTTLHTYELKAETYERYSAGDKYVIKFKANGDYLAYFAMLLHKRPNAAAIDDYFDSDVEEFKDFVNVNSSVAAIGDHASSCWWGDGDDYIIYLKNLDTGETLYEGDNESFDEYEDLDDDEDWEE